MFRLVLTARILFSSATASVAVVVFVAASVRSSVVYSLALALDPQRSVYQQPTECRSHFWLH